MSTKHEKIANSGKDIPDIVKFLRRKDYKFLKELGQGACGRTVLLFDETIGEKFVCKKYVPFSEEYREELFTNFIQEIKLLHLMHHQNIVRVFNYYIFDEECTGYILMEEVEGEELDRYLRENPENVNDIFLQAIEGFAYLEASGVLHRDIRPQNIMVGSDGILKVIDFGFGKQIQSHQDFGKSISLNWWCDPPPELQEGTYNYRSEIYFVGKLFQELMLANEIEHFEYKSLLQKMCNTVPEERPVSFEAIKQSILENQFLAIDFSESEKKTYREFSDSLAYAVSKIEYGSKYHLDIDNIQKRLEDLYKRVMLEEYLPNCSEAIKCFINGQYFFKKSYTFPVEELADFISLLRGCSKEKRNIILSNIHSKLDAVDHYSEGEDFDDEIPF